jgi:hypothetical protein
MNNRPTWPRPIRNSSASEPNMSSSYEKMRDGIRDRLARMSPEDRSKAIELMQTKAALVREARSLGIPTETPADIAAIPRRIKERLQK